METQMYGLRACGAMPSRLPLNSLLSTAAGTSNAKNCAPQLTGFLVAVLLLLLGSVELCAQAPPDQGRLQNNSYNDPAAPSQPGNFGQQLSSPNPYSDSNQAYP